MHTQLQVLNGCVQVLNGVAWHVSRFNNHNAAEHSNKLCDITDSYAR